MIIVMKKSATEIQIDAVIGWIESVGTGPILLRGWKGQSSASSATTGARSNLNLAEHLPGWKRSCPS